MWPLLLKREVEAAGCAPGAPMSVAARQYDVTTREERSGRLLDQLSLRFDELEASATKNESTGKEAVAKVKTA
jgi:hypothetical protein